MEERVADLIQGMVHGLDELSLTPDCVFGAAGKPRPGTWALLAMSSCSPSELWEVSDPELWLFALQGAPVLLLGAGIWGSCGASCPGQVWRGDGFGSLSWELLGYPWDPKSLKSI